jgi:hypothetical protein
VAIEGLRKHQRRHPKGCYFLELPPERRRNAQRRLDKSLARARARGTPITPRRLGAMVASAASLSGMTTEQLSARGRMMRATQGGYAVQRRYRARRINPTLKATFVRLGRQGHTESARRFYNEQRGKTRPEPTAPVACYQRQVPNPLRTGAPPMTVTIGRSSANVPASWRRAKIPPDAD